MIEKGIEEFEEIKFNGQFWMGVADGTGCALYDDFRDNHMKPAEFINFIDYNVHNLNIKGSQIKNRYRTIIITSVQILDQCWATAYAGEPAKQWLRRCKVIDMYNEPKIPPFRIKHRRDAICESGESD